MIIPLKKLLPTADDVLNADLDALGGLLLTHLQSCKGVSPVYQHAGLKLDYFLAFMERRNIGLGPLPDDGPEYGIKQPAVTQAFVEAWDWLVRNGLLLRNHQQPADWYLISRKGEDLLQRLARREEDNLRIIDHDQAAVPEKWDVFISHASEDKPYVAPLTAALRVAGVSVWYDNLVLNWGDDLRPTIDNGLIKCRFGIVVLSKAFLKKKKWTEHELNSLFAREQAGRKLVLPIWHGITRDDLLEYSPGLADRLAKISTSDSYDSIVKSLIDLLGRSIPDAASEERAPTIGAVSDAEETYQEEEEDEQRAHTPEVVKRLRNVAGRRGSGRSPADEELNLREIELLWTAAKDPQGEITCSNTLDGEGMRANGRQFLAGVDARNGAEWLGALRRLEDRGFIEPLSTDRDLFKVTDEGYEAADHLEGFARWHAEAIVLRAHYLNAPSRELTLSCKGIIAIPARYFADKSGADGSVVRSLKERRSLLVEGVNQSFADDWQPTEVEFKDTITGKVDQFLVDGMTLMRPARMKLPILD